jgi:hypothetical protein
MLDSFNFLVCTLLNILFICTFRSPQSVADDSGSDDDDDDEASLRCLPDIDGVGKGYILNSTGMVVRMDTIDSLVLKKKFVRAPWKKGRVEDENQGEQEKKRKQVYDKRVYCFSICKCPTLLLYL